jgi:hypothetical protein
MEHLSDGDHFVIVYAWDDGICFWLGRELSKNKFDRPISAEIMSLTDKGCRIYL